VILGSGSNGATGFFDFLFGRGADQCHVHGQLAQKLAVAQDLDGVAGTGDQAHVDDGFHGDRGAVGEVVEVIDRNGFDLVAEGSIAEAFLGKTTMHWHLAAFETWADGTAGTGLLALVTTAGSLAVTGAFTTAYALAAVLGTWLGFYVVKSHE